MDCGFLHSTRVTLLCQAAWEQRHGCDLQELTGGFYLCYCLFNVYYGEYIGFRFMVQ